MKAPSLSANFSFSFLFLFEQFGIQVLIMWVPFNLDLLFMGPGVGTNAVFSGQRSGKVETKAVKKRFSFLFLFLKE